MAREQHHHDGVRSRQLPKFRNVLLSTLLLAINYIYIAYHVYIYIVFCKEIVVRVGAGEPTIIAQKQLRVFDSLHEHGNR